MVMTAWRKLLERTVSKTQPTPAEQGLLKRMTQVLELHTANALSMTGGSTS